MHWVEYLLCITLCLYVQTVFCQWTVVPPSEWSYFQHYSSGDTSGSCHADHLMENVMELNRQIEQLHTMMTSRLDRTHGITNAN